MIPKLEEDECNPIKIEKKPLNFFVVLCKHKKKIVKYFKINRIKKKIILDVKKMADEENLTYDKAIQTDFFKLLILKKIHDAIEGKKDIYYIPYFNDEIKKNPTRILNVKTLIEDNFNFNLLCFYHDFDKPTEVSEILNEIHEFDFIQLLKNY